MHVQNDYINRFKVILIYIINMLYSIITNIILLSFPLISPRTKLGGEGHNKLKLIDNII